LDTIDIVDGHKVKRFFRARNKLTQGNLVSHITQRAAGKDPCFVEDDDFLCMLKFLKNSAQKHDYEIYSFCLMGNHVHLLLRPNQGNLQDVMRDLFSRYAMRFNRKYERRGHLFGGPYRQAVCLDEAYLMAASTYIHLNPVKAEIVDDPKEYRWSSVRLFVDEPKYRNLLEKAAKLHIDYPKAQESGVEDFRKKLIKVFPKIFGKMTTAKTVAKIDGMDILNMQALEQGINDTVTQYGKRRPGSRLAMKFLIEQLLARGFKRYEIAERLRISPKTVYNILKQKV